MAPVVAAVPAVVAVAAAVLVAVAVTVAAVATTPTAATPETAATATAVVLNFFVSSRACSIADAFAELFRAVSVMATVIIKFTKVYNNNNVYSIHWQPKRMNNTIRTYSLMYISKTIYESITTYESVTN